jgi:hypothetical protein
MKPMRAQVTLDELIAQLTQMRKQNPDLGSAHVEMSCDMDEGGTVPRKAQTFLPKRLGEPYVVCLMSR